MTAQNQHYVPKFILRQFLCDEKNERVAVYDKHENRSFVTSIKNVMAERRFNDFMFEDDWIVSFEPIASGAEDVVLPAYKEVLDSRRLTDSVEQKGALALLMAFQFVRTKAHRDRWKQFEEGLKNKVEAMGHRLQDVEGWENWKPDDADRLKREHIVDIRHSLKEFAQIIAQKDFILAQAATGRSFYLGDNPVSLHNQREFGPYGNLGLALPGIEIYMPLSANLLLGAWCPSIMEPFRAELTASNVRRAEMLRLVLGGKLSSSKMKEVMDEVRPHLERIENLVSAVDEGRPLDQTDENMDFYNSLQTQFASRYIVCQKADFDLASRYNQEFPKYRSGVQIRMG